MPEVEMFYACPACGGATVDFSSLVGGRGSCTTCKWAGSRDELVGIPLMAEAGQREEVLLAIRNDLRSVYARASSDFGRFLIKWGFVDAVNRGGKLDINKAQLVRYMNAIAQASFAAVLEERRKQAEEPSSG